FLPYTIMLPVQKKSGSNPSEINKAIRLFSDDIALLDAYYPKKIYSKYIIRVSEKGFIVVDHPSEVYEIPDAYECIDGSLPLRLVLDIDMRQKSDPINSKYSFLDEYKISRKDLLFRILIACADIIYFDLKHLITLNAFILANLREFVEKVAKRVGKPYSKFIDIDLYKSHFSLRFLG
ncbi:5758_t:CDS:2, partial [Racocetra persica]